MTPSQLEHELSQLSHKTEWVGMDQWLRDQGFIKDVGTEYGGYETSGQGTDAAVAATYRNAAAGKNAVMEHLELHGTGGRNDRYHIMVMWLENGVEMKADYLWDDATGTVIAPSPESRTFWEFARSWGACTLGGCAAAATACGIGNMIDGEVAFAPCFGGWCAGAAVGCAITTALR